MPVIDGVSAAVKMVESLVALGLSTSKARGSGLPGEQTVKRTFSGIESILIFGVAIQGFFEEGYPRICVATQAARRMRSGRIRHASPCSLCSIMKRGQKTISARRCRSEQFLSTSLERPAILTKHVHGLPVRIRQPRRVLGEFIMNFRNVACR